MENLNFKKKLYNKLKKQGLTDDEISRVIDVTLESAEELSQTKHADEDGFCVIYQKYDGIYIKCFAPQGAGKSVDAGEINEHLKKRQVYSYDEDELERYIISATGKEYKITDSVIEYPNLGENISLRVSNDNMYVYLTVPKKFDMDVEKEIYSLLQNQGITYGIKKQKIQEVGALAQNENCVIYHTVIAEGKWPTEGAPAYIDYKFEVSKKPVPLKMSDGRVNYHELNLIKNVVKEQVLAVKNPPQYGLPGVNVYGGEIPPVLGKDLSLLPGKNVKLSPDNKKLISLTNGHVYIDNERVCVDEIFTVNQDVDYSTGDVNFEGTVVILGTVKDAFKVEATGDIEIIGQVESSEVISNHGSILIHGGVAGKGKAKIKAKYKVEAKYIESAWVSAGDVIKVKEFLMHSYALSRGKIEAFEAAGKIIGGVSRAQKEIKAKQIGNEMGTKTEVRIEKFDSQAYIEELSHIEQTLKKIDMETKMIERNVLSKISHNGSQIENENVMHKLVEYSDLDTKQKIYFERKESLMKQLKISPSCAVRAKDIIYPEVKIVIGTQTKKIMQPHHYVSFYCFEEEIKFLPFE